MYSLYYNQWGSANVAVGTYSLFFNQNSSNTAVGDSSLYSNTNGSENVAIGRNSLYYNTTGWGNTAVGRSSLINSTGSSNIAIGYQAGDNLTAGDTNIIIGYDIDAQSTTGSNQLSIGNVIFGGGGFGTGTTVGTGCIGIGGVQDGTDKLRVYGDVKVGTSGTNGCIKRFDGAALTGTCSSDERFKEEVTSMSGILNKVANLQAVTYKFNQLGKTTILVLRVTKYNMAL
ncbi:tail fiber domain-containing protein [Candidatus Nomurabacteria bacterium]|nr:tail fiber domain-containing protein [Candidatus Nomurabacteria bacterium]